GDLGVDPELNEHEVRDIVGLAGVEEDEVARAVEDEVVAAVVGDGLDGLEDALLDGPEELLLLAEQLALGAELAAAVLPHLGPPRGDLLEGAGAVLLGVEELARLELADELVDLRLHRVELGLPLGGEAVHLLAGRLVLGERLEDDLGVHERQPLLGRGRGGEGDEGDEGDEAAPGEGGTHGDHGCAGGYWPPRENWNRQPGSTTSPSAGSTNGSIW